MLQVIELKIWFFVKTSFEWLEWAYSRFCFSCWKYVPRKLFQTQEHDNLMFFKKWKID